MTLVLILKSTDRLVLVGDTAPTAKSCWNKVMQSTNRDLEPNERGESPHGETRYTRQRSGHHR